MLRRLVPALVIPGWPRRKGPDETLAPYFRHGFLGRHPLLTGAALAAVAALYGLVFGVTATTFLVQLLIPVALIAFLALGLLPENGVVFARTLTVLFFLFFFALAVWPDYLALSIGALPWITVNRLVAIPMSLIFLISLSQSQAYRDALSQRLNAVPVVWKALAIYFAISFATLIVSDKLAVSVNKLIIAIYAWGAIFLLATQLFAQAGAARRFALLLWAGVLVCCLIGLLEARMGQVVWAGHVPQFLQIEDEAVARILSGTVRSAIGVHRVQGKFTTALSLAEFLALVTPFVIHFIVIGRSLLERAAAAATLPLIFVVIAKTDSRLGIVGFGLAALGYLFYWALRRWRSDQRSVFAPLILLAYPMFMVLVLLSSFFVTRVHNAVWGSGAHEASNTARVEQLRDGVDIVLRQPWGHGIGRAAETLGHTNLLGTLTIDNFYLSIAIEAGVIGMIAYFAAFFVALFVGARTVLFTDLDEETAWLVPALLSIGNYVVIKAVLSQQDNQALAFAVLGMAVALIHRAGSHSPAPRAGSLPGSTGSG